MFGIQNRIKKQNIVNNLRAFSNLLNINPILYANNIYAGPNMRKHKIALTQLSKTIVKSNAAETKINNITFKKKITKSNKNVPNQYVDFLNPIPYKDYFKKNSVSKTGQVM